MFPQLSIVHDGPNIPGRTYAQHAPRIILVIPKASHAHVATVGMDGIPHCDGIESLINDAGEASSSSISGCGVVGALFVTNAWAPTARPYRRQRLLPGCLSYKAHLTESAGPTLRCFGAPIGCNSSSRAITTTSQEKPDG